MPKWERLRSNLNMDMKKLSDNKINLIVLVWFSLYVTACYRIPALNPLNFTMQAAASFFTLSPVVAIAMWCQQRPPIVFPSFALLGITLGVIFDASLDSVDRNLFPLEVILFAAVIAPSVIVGMLCSYFLKQRRKTNAQKA